MKNLRNVLTTVIIALFSLNSVTAQKMSKPQTVVSTVVINKSATEVWQVLAKIDGLEKVIPSLLSETHIEGNGKAYEGCVRSCKAPDGNVTREKIVKLDNKGMYYSYEFVEGVPAKMTNSFKVISLNENTCKVIWTSEYSFMENPMMKEDQFFAFVNMAGQKIADEVKTYFSI